MKKKYFSVVVGSVVTMYEREGGGRLVIPRSRVLIPGDVEEIRKKWHLVEWDDNEFSPEGDSKNG